MEDCYKVNLPPTVSESLQEFCAAGKSGNLQVDIKNGRIVSGKLTELLQIDRHRGINT